MIENVAYSKYILSVSLQNDAHNLHSIFGDEDNAMSLPPAYQADAGVNFGGINPEIIANIPALEYDSWLTIGETAGADDSLTFLIDDSELQAWTANSGIEINDGVLLFFGGTAESENTPGSAPSEGAIVVAELTIPRSSLPATVRMNMQGHTQDRSVEIDESDMTDDWVDRSVEFIMV